MATKKSDEGFLDLNLSETKKKKIRIDGDATKIIELNLSDMGIISRLNESYAKLDTMAVEVAELLQVDTDDTDELTSKLSKIDKDMKDLIDYTFDSPIAEVCSYGGTMYDLLNGKFRFEHIIEQLSTLYTDNIQSELAKTKARISKHTSKYTRKK